MVCYSLHFTPTEAECREVERLLDEVRLTRTQQVWDYDAVTAAERQRQKKLNREIGFSFDDLGYLIDPDSPPLEAEPPETVTFREFLTAIRRDEDGIRGDDVEDIIDNGCLVDVCRMQGTRITSDTYRWLADTDWAAVRSLYDRIVKTYEDPKSYHYYFTDLLTFIGFGRAELAEMRVLEEKAMREMYAGQPDPEEGHTRFRRP
jgi:hypothetical protein